MSDNPMTPTLAPLIQTPRCLMCADEYAPARWRLGIKFCMPCGEKVSAQVRRTVAPMHKSNYMLITDLDDLKGINNKGGLIK